MLITESASFGDGRLAPFAESVWTATTPVRFAGTWFPHVMTVVRLTSGDVLLHSPCSPSTDLTSEIAAIGRVAYIVAPNWFHDLYLKEYRMHYKDAAFWAPAFLQRRHKSMIDHVLNENARPPWFHEMPHVALSGLLTFDECVLFHRASQAAIVGDFLMNVRADKRDPPITRLGYRLLGLNGELKVFPVLRCFGVANRAAMRRAALAILGWKPERLIVAHGTPIRVRACDRIRDAFQWLLP